MPTAACLVTSDCSTRLVQGQEQAANREVPTEATATCHPSMLATPEHVTHGLNPSSLDTRYKSDSRNRKSRNKLASRSTKRDGAHKSSTAVDRLTRDRSKQKHRMYRRPGFPTRECKTRPIAAGERHTQVKAVFAVPAFCRHTGKHFVWVDPRRY